MSLIDTIHRDMISALKAGDGERRDALRMALTALKNEQIAKKTPSLSDDDATAVLRRLIRQRDDAAALFRQGGNEQSAAKEEAERSLLSSYVPQQMDEGALRALISTILKDEKPASMGAAIGLVMQRVKGVADGAVVRALVEELLKNA